MPERLGRSPEDELLALPDQLCEGLGPGALFPAQLGLGLLNDGDPLVDLGKGFREGSLFGEGAFAKLELLAEPVDRPLDLRGRELTSIADATLLVILLTKLGGTFLELSLSLIERLFPPGEPLVTPVQLILELLQTVFLVGESRLLPVQLAGPGRERLLALARAGIAVHYPEYTQSSRQHEAQKPDNPPQGSAIAGSRGRSGAVRWVARGSLPTGSPGGTGGAEANVPHVGNVLD